MAKNHIPLSSRHSNLSPLSLKAWVEFEHSCFDVFGLTECKLAAAGSDGQFHEEISLFIVYKLKKSLNTLMTRELRSFLTPSRSEMIGS